MLTGRSISIPLLGEMLLVQENGKYFWFKYAKDFIDELPIEVTIHTWRDRPPIEEQIDIINRFPADYKTLLGGLIRCLEADLKGTELAKTYDELMLMYYLCAIEIWPNATIVEYTLEPHFSVTSRYDFFHRFRMIDDKIVRMM